MRGEYGLEIGTIYAVFFILLLGFGGYWIIRSNTWMDYNVLYGPPETFTGKVTRIETYCDDPMKTIVMVDRGDSQAYVYMPFRFTVMTGDRVSITAYPVKGRGLIFDAMRSPCEPEGFHHYSVKAYNARIATQVEAKPWQK
jgi:hypothetical protein